jgi:hypothetical protein
MFLPVFALAACLETKEDDDDDGDVDDEDDTASDTDTSSDTDGPSDTDADTDTDGPSDTDTSSDTDADTDTDTDTDTSSDTDTGSGGQLLVQYGWTSTFTVDTAANSATGAEVFWFNDVSASTAICENLLPGVGTPSEYACDQCDFALNLELEAPQAYSNAELASGDYGCDLIGITYDADGYDVEGTEFTRVGIGHASTFDSYNNVMVYYVTDGSGWGPVAYSDFDGTTWEYTYTNSDFYGYVYY